MGESWAWHWPRMAKRWVRRVEPQRTHMQSSEFWAWGLLCTQLPPTESKVCNPETGKRTYIV